MGVVGIMRPVWVWLVGYETSVGVVPVWVWLVILLAVVGIVDILLAVLGVLHNCS